MQKIRNQYQSYLLIVVIRLIRNQYKSYLLIVIRLKKLVIRLIS